MSAADAIRIFLQQTVNDGALPFRPHCKDLSRLREETQQILSRVKSGEEKLIDGEQFFADVAVKYGLEE